MRRLDSLEPVMTCSGPVTWPDAVWIGSLELPCVISDSVMVADSDGYRRARLLVFRDERPINFIECAVEHGTITGRELREKLAAIRVSSSPEPCQPNRTAAEKISVVICTRNRPDALQGALRSVLGSCYSDFEVIVVDNASDDDSVAAVLAAIDDARIRLVDEPRPGLAIARNAGVLAASGSLVAFTDDDVIVDRNWLRWLADAASRGVGCVTGMVVSGELRTESQWNFERIANWAVGFERTAYSVAEPPLSSPLFPFQAGRYGTGANFAMRRDSLLEMGGFDEGLGAGSPASGGEDLDVFVRTLAAGQTLVYEPAAVVWHRHRSTAEELRRQIRDYRMGLGAWLASITVDAELRRLAVSRGGAAIRHLSWIVSRGGLGMPHGTPLGRLQELVMVARGALAYARSRRQGRRSRPLLT